MFFDRFCELCKKKGISPSKAALEIGIAKSTVSAWKNMGTSPQMAMLQKIAEYFDVTTDYLTGSDQKEIPPSVVVHDEDGERIVLDDETLEYIDSLRKRPEMKMLFSVSKKATKEDIIKAVKIIEALSESEE